MTVKGTSVRNCCLDVRTWLCRIVLALLAGGVLVRLGCAVESGGTPGPQGQTEAIGPAEVLIVSEEDECLLAVVTPLAAKLAGKFGPVPLLVTSTPPAADAQAFLDRLRPSRRLLIQSSAVRTVRLQRTGPNSETLLLGPDPTGAGIGIARTFWKSSEKIVIADLDEPAAALLGATLAAHLSVPFVPLVRWERTQRLPDAAGALGVKEMLLVTSKAADKAEWAKAAATADRAVTVLDLNEVQRRVIETIGPHRIRNVIVARAPADSFEATDPSARLAAYLSLVRKAPVVLCRSAHAWEAELRVKQLVGTHALKPQTVTILADYQAIGVSVARDPSRLGSYEVEVEPCSLPGPGGAAAFGVGRIPFGKLSAASLLIARGIARERLLGTVRRRVLLVANPNAAYGPLPLAETIARLTAAELRNFGVPLDELYGKVADEKAFLAAAEKAHVILYQGHITDLQLFRSPAADVQPADQQGLPLAEAPLQAGPSPPTTDLPAAGPNDAPRHEEHADETRGGKTPPPTDQAEPEDTGAPCDDSPSPSQPDTPAKPAPKLALAGLPLVVLQSCHSLEEKTAESVFGSGGVGLVGSVTGIHSASGSAFMKAYFDNVLYRGATVGEALRDARNYFLCLARLKAGRGHKEQAKVHRVGLSFRLWGDPEVRVLPAAAEGFVLPPVAAGFAGDEACAVSIPRRRLPEGRTEKYAGRAFPGSQVAGIVQRVKNTTQRRLMPTYFFRLRLPATFAARNYKTLQRDGETPNRAVFTTDPLARYVYVLYFPQKEKARDRFTLRFGQ